MDVVEVHQVAVAHALCRSGTTWAASGAFLADRQAFREPVRHLEVGLCSRLKTWTSSCFMTRAQLKGLAMMPDLSRGEHIATSGPCRLQWCAGPVGRWTRPLNIS